MNLPCTILIALPSGEEVECDGVANVVYEKGEPGSASNPGGYCVEDVTPDEPTREEKAEMHRKFLEEISAKTTTCEHSGITFPTRP